MHILDNAHNTWGESDVTKSMVTIRSPFCGYNTSQYVQLNGEDLSCYSNKSESVYKTLYIVLREA